MDIQKIEFPKHLLEHNLSAQELMNIPPDKVALAKDWNVIKRQNEWMMEQLVLTRNIVVEHDQQLDYWKRVRWLIGGVITLSAVLLGLMKAVGVLK